MGNKGSMFDMFLVLIVILGFGMTTLISIYLMDSFQPYVDSNFEGTEGVTVFNNVKETFRLFDIMFIFIYIMLCGLPILFASLVKSHPILIIFNFLIVIIYFLITPTISNIMHEFWIQPAFAPYAAGGGGSYTFVGMTYLFQLLPYISVGVSTLLMIAMFAKGQ